MSDPFLVNTRNSDAVNTTGSFDDSGAEEDAFLFDDPDLEWILNAAALDSSSTYDHSDHEHALPSSSSSESVDDAMLSIFPDLEEGAAVVVEPAPDSTPLVTLPEAFAPPSVKRPRLPKINGDATILNLYAATVAKAVAPLPKEETVTVSASTRISPNVTTPSNKQTVDDPLLQLFASTVQKASTITPCSSSNATKKSAARTMHRRPMLSSPKEEYYEPPLALEPQYLQLEIAKELDGSSINRRFQLAIQSHISQLTLGSVEEEQEEEIELSLDNVLPRPPEALELPGGRHPALAYDHARMRNKLWGPKTPPKISSDPPMHLNPQHQPLSMTGHHLPISSINERANSNTRRFEEYMKNKYPSVDWCDRVVYVSVVFILPFTYRVGSNLPQLYFLIEMVHIYDMDVNLAGVYLLISFLCRFAMRASSLRAPFTSALAGTMAAMAGYTLLVIASSVKHWESSSDADTISSMLFVLGNILLGFNEIGGLVQIMVFEWRGGSWSSLIDPKSISLLWDLQWRVIQVSTIITFALGGLIYEYFDLLGVAAAGILIMVVQLVSLVVLCFLGPLNSSQLSRNPQAFCQLLWTDFDFPNYLVQFISSPDNEKPTFSNGEESDACSSSNDFKLQQKYRSSSFQSILNLELETIEETPATELDVDEDPRISSDDPGENSRSTSPRMLYGGESVASSSSATPPHDNRTNSRPCQTSDDPEHRDNPFMTSSMQSKSATSTPPLGWINYFVIVGNTVHPTLNGLVFGTAALYLFDHYDQAKYTIGFVYAASSLCGMLPSMIFHKIVEERFIKHFKMCWTVCLFGCTYMILLTAISFLSTFIVGLLALNFLLGFYVRSFNEYQGQMVETEVFRNQNLSLYRQWFRRFSYILALLFAPFLYNIFPRLPYMVGSGCSFVFTVLVFVGVDCCKGPAETADAESDRVTRSRPGQEAGNEAISPSESVESKLSCSESKFSLYGMWIRHESWIEHNIAVP